MKLIDILKNKYIGLILAAGILATSCESGLTYDDVPESVYSEVGIQGFNMQGRELFENSVYATNWNKYTTYISTVTIASNTAKVTWENKTGKDYTINGTVVKAGESIDLVNTMTEEADASAPEGKVYILTVYIPSRITYSSPNKGYLFDASKLSGDFKLVDPDANNRSQKVSMPVKKNELIGRILPQDYYACSIIPQNGAPALGTPGDFSEPRRYMIVNNSRLPEGVTRYQRLYELRPVFLP